MTTRPEPTTTPAWATVFERPCVTAKCSDCGAPYGDEDSGVAWHFESIEVLVTQVAGDVEEEGEDARWCFVDDALLCQSCVASRVCAVQGHDWHHYPAAVHPDGYRSPEVWSCTRYCNTPATKVDPTKGGAQ